MREQETEAAPNQKLPLFVKSISKRSTPTDSRRTMSWELFRELTEEVSQKIETPIFGSHLSSQIAKWYPAAAVMSNCRTFRSRISNPQTNPQKYVLYELPRTISRGFMIHNDYIWLARDSGEIGSTHSILRWQNSGLRGDRKRFRLADRIAAVGLLCSRVFVRHRFSSG